MKLFSLFFSVTLLVGCGQMGPLYLPKESTKAAATHAEVTTQATADTSS